MIELVDPVTRAPLPRKTLVDNWPPKSLSIYADLDYERKPRMTDDTEPTPAPDAPDDTPAEPADDVVNEPPKPTEPETPKP